MKAENAHTFTLGITGGIGSGKTLVCEMFADLGARVVYADLEAKKLMVENEAVRDEITVAFGPESYHADGTLNRKHLAGLVFGNDEAVAQINGIVHPRMAEVLSVAKATAEEDNIKLLVYEAALIYESGSAGRLDAVAVVHTPAALRIQRVVTRDNTTEEQVKNRMKHQLPPDELLDKADYIILNDGSLETLKERVEHLYHKICGI
ncbi:MAG: dephospho-CoA kinase [Rhodothermales bacterium]